MIVVVDTSVIVSAMPGPGGASRSVPRGALTGTLHPLVGQALLDEYEAALGRDSLFEGCAISRRDREDWLDACLSR